MYIDTSCLVAYYLPQAKSGDVQKIIRSAKIVSISYLTEIEMLSAIRKKQRMDEIPVDHGLEAYQLFKEHVKNGLYDITELSPSVFKASEFILQKSDQPLRTLDAIHLGVAYENKMALFTFDTVLIQAAKELKINTI